MAASILLVDLIGVKAYSGITGTGNDTILDHMIEAASEWIESHCGRLFKKESRTEIHNAWTDRCVFQLRAWPIVSVTSVKSARDWDFDGATAVDEADYDIDTARGKLRFKAGVLETGPRSLQVVYEGGLEATTADIIANHPTLTLACDQIVDGLWRRKHKLDQVTESISSMAAKTRKDLRIPSVTKILLGPYRSSEAI